VIRRGLLGNGEKVTGGGSFISRLFVDAIPPFCDKHGEGWLFPDSEQSAPDRLRYPGGKFPLAGAVWMKRRKGSKTRHKLQTWFFPKHFIERYERRIRFAGIAGLQGIGPIGRQFVLDLFIQ
jgi:hypothetical protein